MVNIFRLSEKVEDLMCFFESVLHSTTVSLTDKNSAAYGYGKMEWIKKSISMSEGKPSNATMKKIHAKLSSATRGVEGFIDDALMKEFQERCIGMYDIMTDLEQNIKW